MATLPTAAILPTARSLGARPIPQPYTGVSRLDTSNDRLLQIPGQSMEHSGTQLFNAGDQMRVAFAQEKERVDKARAEDAFTELRNEQLDLTIGEQNGFHNIKGGDAVKQPLLKSWNEKFDSASDGISSRLENEQQKELFRQRSQISKTAFIQDILTHLARESGVYKQQVFASTVDVEKRFASAKWNNEADVYASLERTSAATNEYARANGISGIALEDMRMKTASQIHASVIGQALATGDYKYAASWFEQHRDDIDPVTANHVQRAVEDGTQKELFNNYQAEFLVNKDSKKGLNVLGEKVIKDDTLNEDRKNLLIGRIQNRNDALERQAELNQQRAEHALERQVNSITNLITRGYEPTTEQIEPLLIAAKGTDVEPLVRQMIATSKETRKFRGMEPLSQEAYITQFEAQVRKDPSKYDVALVDKFKSIAKAQQEEVKKDQITFSIRQGFIDPTDTAAQSIDLSNPDKLLPQLTARYGLSRAISGKYSVAQKPLTEQEVHQLTNSLEHAGPKQKIAYFGALAESSKYDIDGYKAIMGQLAPDNPVLAHAGISQGRGDTQTADLLVRGQAILHPNKKEDGSPDKGKLWPMPSGAEERSMRQMFSQYTGDAYSKHPEAQSAIYQSAMAIYAARVSDSGNATGIVNTAMWKESIKLATGGVHKYEGHHTVLPNKMSYGDFKDHLYQKISQVQNLPEGMTNSRLKDMPVRAIADGKYVFMAGDGDQGDKNGKRIIIDLNTP